MKYNIGLVALALATTTLTGCMNDDDNSTATAEKPMTERQVADFFTQSMQVNSGGLMSDSRNAVDKVLKITKKDDFSCDTDYSDNASFNYDDGFLISSNFNSDYSIDFDCNNTAIPNDASVSVDTDYNYKSKTLDSKSNGVFNADISGIHSENEFVFLNGDYSHSGESTFSYFNEREFSNTTKLTLNNLKLDKGGLLSKPRVQSGEGVVEYTFVSSNGAEYDFVGAIKFKSSSSGEITINGKTFPFGWGI